MARVCCVESCRAVPRDDIAFFNFPIKHSLQKKWKDAIRPTQTLSIESVICSRHFAEQDYESVRGKVRLKARVVPTIFDHVDPPKSLPENGQEDPKENGQEDPKENGHTDSPGTEEHTIAAEIKQSEPVPDCGDTSKDTKVGPGESALEQGLEADGHEGSHETGYEVPIEFNCEVQLTEGDENETIECVPEAILHQHEDSDSHSEGDIHKEDIEDIIANYHIKQDPKLAERLKASQEKENLSNNQDSKSDDCISDKESNNSSKNSNSCGKVSNSSDKVSKNSGKRDSLPPDKDNDDCVEVAVTYQPSRKRRKPEYIEISVDKDATDKSNDCLMVMENVEVDIDPSALMFTQGDPGINDDSDVEIQSDVETETVSKRKNDPISLLTSSDEDDVIIEEPHIDMVEVSDETDEDDVPLTRLVRPAAPPAPPASPHVGRILWGTLSEYYCYKCKYTTTSHGDYSRHKQEHEKVFHVCEVCDFSTVSKSQFVRHKRRHRDEKMFKCHLCDYKAKHHMSVVYHLKSHGVGEREARMSLDASKSKCPKCKMLFTHIKNEYLKHVKRCKAGDKVEVCNVVVKKGVHACALCNYKTKRARDMKRHQARMHAGDSGGSGGSGGSARGSDADDADY